MPLPLVVLAAGLSTRYGRLKQLESLGPAGEAIMDFNVFDAMRAGFDSVIYVVRSEILDDVRGHVHDIFGGLFPVDFAVQELSELPDGYTAPPDRRRPWGTAHAVLTAAKTLTGPFAVCNADDLYGPGAFQLLADHLRSQTTEGGLVGYRLDNTLSGAGGVARGVCVLGRDDLLERVTEIREIARREGWITGIETDGTPVELDGGEMASMNLWGIQPPMVAMLGRQFERFLDHHGSDPDAEFFLSTAINHQIEIEASRVRVLPAPDVWFGITHAADRDRSEGILMERVAAGVYPPRLADALIRLR